MADSDRDQVVKFQEIMFFYVYVLENKTHKQIYTKVNAPVDEGIAPLIEALRSDGLGYLNAVAAIVDIGEPAVQPLIEALQHADENVRKNAAEALGDILVNNPSIFREIYYALRELLRHGKNRDLSSKIPARA